MLNRLRQWQRPAIAGVLAWVLLLGQALGLAHGVAHSLPPVSIAQAQDDGCAEYGDLFASHEQSSDVCKLLDQIGHADALPLATPASAQPAPAQHVDATAACGVALRWAAVYNARAPPWPLV
jgi:hypothetical protein